jgi:hypothetical protein
MNQEDRERKRMEWQYRRLIVEIPVALLLIHLSIKENGWPSTYYWLKYFSVNVSILVALTKKLKWM